MPPPPSPLYWGSSASTYTTETWTSTQPKIRHPRFKPGDKVLLVSREAMQALPRIMGGLALPMLDYARTIQTVEYANAATKPDYPTYEFVDIDWNWDERLLTEVQVNHVSRRRP